MSGVRVTSASLAGPPGGDGGSLLSPLRSQIRVVLGQQRFNVTDANTRTFGVEQYIFPKHFSVFNPTLHDIGNH